MKGSRIVEFIICLLISSIILIVMTKALLNCYTWAIEVINLIAQTPH